MPDVRAHVEVRKLGSVDVCFTHTGEFVGVWVDGPDMERQWCVPLERVVADLEELAPHMLRARTRAAVRRCARRVNAHFRYAEDPIAW